MFSFDDYDDIDVKIPCGSLPCAVELCLTVSGGSPSDIWALGIIILTMIESVLFSRSVTTRISGHYPRGYLRYQNMFSSAMRLPQRIPRLSLKVAIVKIYHRSQPYSLRLKC